MKPCPFPIICPKVGAAIALIYILGMALIWLAPETKGRPLPE
jgi:hypothetical protein